MVGFDGQDAVVTDVEAEVLEHLRGDGGDHVSFTLLGGRADGLGMIGPSSIPQVGEEVIVVIHGELPFAAVMPASIAAEVLP